MIVSLRPSTAVQQTHLVPITSQTKIAMGSNK